MPERVRSMEGLGRRTRTRLSEKNRDDLRTVILPARERVQDKQDEVSNQERDNYSVCSWRARRANEVEPPDRGEEQERLRQEARRGDNNEMGLVGTWGKQAKASEAQ